MSDIDRLEELNRRNHELAQNFAEQLAERVGGWRALRLTIHTDNSMTPPLYTYVGVFTDGRRKVTARGSDFTRMGAINNMIADLDYKLQGGPIPF